jgi:hypothetical protein
MWNKATIIKSVPNSSTNPIYYTRDKTTANPTKTLRVEPLTNSALPFSDSGYGSVAQVNRKAAESTLHMGNMDVADDTKTEYSSVSGTVDVLTDVYLNELVEDIEKALLDASRTAGDCDIKMVFSQLPGLLKSLARRIGHMGQDQKSRDVMVFMSRYRE